MPATSSPPAAGCTSPGVVCCRFQGQGPSSAFRKRTLARVTAPAQRSRAAVRFQSHPEVSEHRC